MNEIKVLLRENETVLQRVSAMGLSDELDIEIVDKVSGAIEVLMTVKRRNVDVVVTTDCEEDKGLASHILAMFPDVTVLMLGTDGKAFIEQRCRQRWTLHSTDNSSVKEALRYAVRHPCEARGKVVG